MIRFGSICSALGLALALWSSEELAAREKTSAPPLYNVSPTFPLPTYDLLRDTIFLLDTVYLEVRLDKQMICQHFRSGRVRQFPCSTGNPRLPEAIATREGIFSVQWKSRRYMSRRFEVWLNYWMPFDGGIGFHGLDGRSYYKYLGRRPSSHGCVRIANETGRELFGSTPAGTVVYVHSGSPARIISFAEQEEGMRLIGAEDAELLKQRLDAVTRSLPDHPALRERLALPAGRKEIGGMEVGRTNRGMRVQYVLPPRNVSLLEGRPVTIPEPEPLRLPATLFPVEDISSYRQKQE